MTSKTPAPETTQQFVLRFPDDQKYYTGVYGGVVYHSAKLPDAQVFSTAAAAKGANTRAVKMGHIAAEIREVLRNTRGTRYTRNYVETAA